MKKPLVSVLIDTYNHERFIEQAIVSVLEQDFPRGEMEILVVDDGSTDRTPEIIHRFEPQVRLRRKANGGQASAFNTGIPECVGEIVAFLDGDDWWARNKLTCVVETFGKNPRAGTVGHGIVQVDSAANRVSALAPGTTGYFDLRSTEGAQTLRNFMAFFGTSRVAIRKSVLMKILPIPEALLVEADEFMSTTAVAECGAMLLAEPLTFYRLHDHNLFQFAANDLCRLRRKMSVLACLAEELPIRLRTANVTPEAVSIIVEPIQVAARRMRLALDGGMPWETYRVERADFRLSYHRTAWGYRVFKALSLLSTLLLPPRLYYRVRSWYAAHNLRRFRSWLGEPTPAAAVREEPLGPTVPPSN